MKIQKKVYLGDSVYAESDGDFLILTTENGFGPSNKIYLDPSVLRSLSQYLRSLINKDNYESDAI